MPPCVNFIYKSSRQTPVGRQELSAYIAFLLPCFPRAVGVRLLAEMSFPALLFDHFMHFMNGLLCKLNAERGER